MNTQVVKNNVVEDKGQLLMFHSPDEDTEIQVKMLDETMWLTQDQMGKLFNTTRQNIGQHINNILKDGELQADSVRKNFFQTAADGKNYNVVHYNLDMIISVGYRVNSRRGTQFRIWATNRLKEYLVKGFTIDEQRLSSFGSKYFEELVAKVREIRTSERESYRKITDIFATSVDYNPKSEQAKNFFATIQNKIHYAVHGHTAAELIVERIDYQKDHMGLTHWKGKTDVRKADATVAKNYLNGVELKLMELLSEQFLSFAEFQSTDQKPMHMRDWIQKLDELLELNEREILRGCGSVSKDTMIHKITEEIVRYRALKKLGKPQMKLRRGTLEAA